MVTLGVPDLRVCAVGDAVGEEVPRPPHGRAPTALALRPVNAIGRHGKCHGWRAAVESEDGALRGQKRRVVSCMASRTLGSHAKRQQRFFGWGAMWSPAGLVSPAQR